MTRLENRPWLFSMIGIAVISWATTAGEGLLLFLIDDGDGINVYGAVFLLLWTLAVPTPVTLHLAAWGLRVLARRRLYRLGRRHAQILATCVPGDQQHLATLR